MTQPDIIEVPAYENLLQFTADYLFKPCSTRHGLTGKPVSGELNSNDLSGHIILLPNPRTGKAFLSCLSKKLNKDRPAIIPPWTGTLRSWARQFCRPTHQRELISEHSRTLLFIEALQQHPKLFKEENQWQVTQALLQFFDELSLNQQNLFTSEEAWQQQLQDAYGIEQQNQHLLNESHLVYTLWHAWQQQLEESALIDETGDYIARLTAARDDPQLNELQFSCVAYTHYCKTEQDFIRSLAADGRCTIIDHRHKLDLNEPGSDSSAPVFYDFIEQAFAVDSERPIRQRASQFIENRGLEHHNQLSADELPFSIFLTANEEQQIRAIDYYVRQNIIDGNNNIAIISEDRKLSRRLRALLERANIQLQDNAGWSLATTQAATIIERWLECIEEDFSAYPLIDCLKSPFIDISRCAIGEQATVDDFRKNVFRFQHDVVFHENISSNIDEYKSALKQRLNRVNWPANSYDDLVSTLDYIEATAAPLISLSAGTQRGKHKIQLSEFLQTLLDSLQQLGVLDCYKDDAAGLVLLDTFDELKQGIMHSDPELSWYDCRVWLGMALEAKHFTPPTNSSLVQLMTLEQAAFSQFDCIVFAATEAQHFPGSAAGSPFFNQAVRASLGLETWEAQRARRLELFKNTLLSAPDILLCACNQENGEEKAVSPWLELMINFYNLIHGGHDESMGTGAKQAATLQNQLLARLTAAGSEVFNCDEGTLPSTSIQPSPALEASLIPERVSASSHQRLINCPYQYFSGDGLRLKPLEELSDELKKSDYGERIHLILQTFHNGHQYYGKAFEQPITEQSRADAEKYLSELSEKIFVKDLADNVLHRSWLYRWQKHIPSYISWQIQHQQDWSFYLSEENMDAELGLDADNKLSVYGRLDRIDRNRENGRHAIIDYKTGKTAVQDDVDNGENVQLATYALLDTEADEVSYLSVDSSNQKVETRSSLSGDELQANRDQSKQRLRSLFAQIRDKKPLPAWGDDTVCCYCNFSGLCRKAEWRE